MFGNISMSRVSVCARSSFLFFLVASELHIHAASLTSSLLHCNFFCSCDVCSSFKNDTCLCVARMSENVSHAEKVWFVSISIVYPQTLLFWNRYECFLQLQTVERLITLHRFCILLFVLVPLLLFSLSDLTFFCVFVIRFSFCDPTLHSMTFKHVSLFAASTAVRMHRPLWQLQVPVNVVFVYENISGIITYPGCSMRLASQEILLFDVCLCLRWDCAAIGFYLSYNR